MYSNCCNHINHNNNQIFSASISHFLPEEETIVNDLTWQQLYDLFFHHQQSNNLIPTVDHQNQNQTVENNNNNNNNREKEEEEVKKVEIISKCSSRKKSSSSSLVSSTTTTTRTRTTSSGKKKDRHSKINTAQGPRDRRMRLSLQVARKFFDLQDMLGFDKASKTVEWLLIQSSSSIKQVMGIITPSISSEDASGIDDNSTTTTAAAQKNHDQHEQKINANANVKSKGKKGKQARRNRTNISAFHDRFARESRKIARERARKRTIEKKILGGGSSNYCPRMNSSSFHQLGLHPELTSCDHHQLLETLDYAPDPPHDHDSSVIWNSPAICSNFHQNSQISHEHQFMDFDRSLLF